jgi:hypothetical protein
VTEFAFFRLAALRRLSEGRKIVEKKTKNALKATPVPYPRAPGSWQPRMASFPPRGCWILEYIPQPVRRPQGTDACDAARQQPLALIAPVTSLQPVTVSNHVLVSKRGLLGRLWASGVFSGSGLKFIGVAEESSRTEGPGDSLSF